MQLPNHSDKFLDGLDGTNLIIAVELVIKNFFRSDPRPIVVTHPNTIVPNSAFFYASLPLKIIREPSITSYRPNSIFISHISQPRKQHIILVCTVITFDIDPLLAITPLKNKPNICSHNFP